MRVIHLERSVPGGLVQPVCGEWGSMDTGWTDQPDGVTCQACRLALGRVEATAPAPVPGARS